MSGFARPREGAAASAPLTLQVKIPESAASASCIAFFSVCSIRFIYDTNSLFAIPFWIHTSTDPFYFCA